MDHHFVRIITLLGSNVSEARPPDKGNVRQGPRRQRSWLLSIPRESSVSGIGWDYLEYVKYRQFVRKHLFITDWLIGRLVSQLTTVTAK
jgi:hypothetical protein